METLKRREKFWRKKKKEKNKEREKQKGTHLPEQNPYRCVLPFLFFSREDMRYLLKIVLWNDVGVKRFFDPFDTRLLRALHSRNLQKHS